MKYICIKQKGCLSTDCEHRVPHEHKDGLPPELSSGDACYSYKNRNSPQKELCFCGCLTKRRLLESQL